MAPYWLLLKPVGHLWNFLGLLQVTVGLSGLAALYGALLVLAAGTRPAGLVARFCGASWLRTFGVYSYALYMLHNPIMVVVRDMIYGPEQFPTLLGSPLPGQLLFYVVATAPALAAAWLSWHLFEKHFLKLKKYFPARHERVKPVSPVRDVDHLVEPAGSVVESHHGAGS
jgi:peptidoglycan/LPS O-acetylase OafA/YrhL